MLGLGVVLVVFSVPFVAFGRQLARLAVKGNRQALRRQGDQTSSGPSEGFFQKVYMTIGAIMLVAGAALIVLARTQN
jgi:hypothetical protein